MTEPVKLEMVVYNEKARNGAWCASPYTGHKQGCPNFRKECTFRRPDFRNIADKYNWWAVTEVFDLKSHAEAMKLKLPDWTDRQCRNPLYWQGSVRRRLREKAEKLVVLGSIILDIPEACGVEVFETMALVGIKLERSPDIVIKVMLVGWPRFL